MAGRDLRSWMAQLETAEELKRVSTRVDWNEEISEIIRRVYLKSGPALLFENIKDHQETWCKRLFVNGLGTRSRMNLMMNLPRDTPVIDTLQTMRRRIKETVKPVSVKTGPVKENIIKGQDIDLFQIPVPKYHAQDAGRYINVFYSAITKDPDTGALNAGIYRGMILSKNKIGVLMIPMKDWGATFEKYRQKGKPMPVAFVYGYDPALLAVSGVCFSGPEYDLAGALRQEPIELVKCETSDIEVPAYAEIIVEGLMLPDPTTYEIEGPYGEGSGYYGEARPRPVVEVKCITYRNDPIFRGAYIGTHGEVIDELKSMVGNSMSAVVWDTLDKQEIPGILDVQVGPVTAVKIHKTYQGQARQIAAALWGSKFAGQVYNVIMVVEEGVDVHDNNSLIWALHHSLDFDRSLVVYPLLMGSPVDPSIPYELRDELKYGAGVQKKLLIDATVDWELHPFRSEWGNSRFPPSCVEASKGIPELVDKKWKQYGI